MSGGEVRFGSALRPLWHLESGARFLNHGSFGACPRAVMAEQERWRIAMEAQPDIFFRESIVPADAPTPLRAAASALAAFVRVDAGSIAFVENATAGTQAVLRSIAFKPGDEILITDHTYNAVRLMVEARCAETGATARVANFPLPATSDGIVEAFRAALTPRVRLAIVDHITSPTALVLPLARIVPELRRFGARILVDGAHAVGHVALDLTRLAADWYVSNAHKWLFAPKGTAFLHASPEAAAITAPLIVSHFAALRFPRAFDYVGTRDYTGWLALPAALRFHEALQPQDSARYRAGLIEHATRLFAGLDAPPVGAEDLCGSMRSFVLPTRRAVTAEEAEGLMRTLWRTHRIQAMSTAFAGRLLLRVSAQVYVDRDDLDALAAALERDGWAAR